MAAMVIGRFIIEVGGRGGEDGVDVQTKVATAENDTTDHERYMRIYGGMT